MAKPETIAKMLPVFHEVFDDDTLVIMPATSAGDVEGWDKSQPHTPDGGDRVRL
jgi:acyl carrier protein